MLRKLPVEIDALIDTPLCRDVPRRELDAVDRLGTVVNVAPGRLLAWPDQHPMQIVVILNGAVIGIPTSGSPRILGRWAWFRSTTDRDHLKPETFETLIPSTVFVIGQREFGALRVASDRLAARLLNPPGSTETDRTIAPSTSTVQSSRV